MSFVFIMPPASTRLATVIILAATAATAAPLTAAEDGFVPLFNGRDLSGWRPVNTAPSTWQVRDGLLICSGKPIGELRTKRMYQNFVLELEWRHLVPRGNAGVFVWADDITAPGVPFHRGIEVQVLENAYGQSRSYTTHGDIFPIHGATMTPVNGRDGSRAFPTEERSRPSPEWNHYRIECRDGTISLAVNGKVVTRGRDCSPRKGYICLESEGGIVHYRNIRIRELPDTPVSPEHIAIAERGFRSLYTGTDLTGWTDQDINRADSPWKVNDWILSHTGEPNAPSTVLTAEAEEPGGDYDFIVDIRPKSADSAAMIFPRGTAGSAPAVRSNAPQVAALLAAPGRWTRLSGQVRGNSVELATPGHPEPITIPLTVPKNARGFSIGAQGRVDFANLYLPPAPTPQTPTPQTPTPQTPTPQTPTPQTPSQQAPSP